MNRNIRLAFSASPNLAPARIYSVTVFQKLLSARLSKACSAVPLAIMPNIGICFVVRMTLGAVSLGSLQFANLVISPFQNHVSVVVCYCAQKEVVRVDAGRIVAPMEDAEPQGNRAVMHLPRNTVCETRGAINRKFLVTFSIFRSRPNPATISLQNLRPESDSDGLLHSRNLASTVAPIKEIL